MPSQDLTSNHYCEFVYNNLSQLVQGPTHLEGASLDLVMTNEEDIVHSIEVIKSQEVPTRTDHYLVSFKLRVAGASAKMYGFSSSI